MEIWYAARVESSRLKTIKVFDQTVKTREIKVLYEADGKRMWHSLHNSEIRAASEQPPDARDGMMAAMLDGVWTDTCSEAELESLGASLNAAIRMVEVTADAQIEIEHAMFMVMVDDKGNKSLEPVASLDARNAWAWRTPRNEREYNRSPQRPLWRTAKELKMDEYKQIHTFDLVYLSDVDLDTYKVYDTIWAYKIKLDGTSDRKLDKLNPRWCLVGTPMDRDMYKSHAETLRMWMFKIILAIKAAHYKKLVAFAFDLKNAFQSTRTDFDKQSGKPTGQPPLYCTQAPGFEQRGPNGEKMVCKVYVGLQGRIDASLLTSTNIWKLVKKLGFARMLADSQAFVYHNGPMVGKDVSLSEIIDSFKATEDSSGQQPPKAWGVFGLHVDDGFGVATGVMDPERNRLVQYLRGGIAIEYAITMTGWRKQLGFIITCDDKEETVSLSAPGPLAELADKVLDGVGRYAPKHIMTAEMESLAPGVVPPIGDPSRGSYLQDQELCRSALGALIWLCNAYPQATPPVNMLCKDMASPSPATLKSVRHVLMHLLAYPDCVKFGPCEGLERPERDADLLQPHGGKLIPYFHFFSDGATGAEARSYSGSVGMLAGGPVYAALGRQHLTAPEVHAIEIVAAGTGLNIAMAINGALQELGIRLGRPTPFYLDSKSSVDVAKSDKAVKHSAWLFRRTVVLHEAVGENLNEIVIFHIPGKDMLADPFTKYLVYMEWRRHMDVLLNKRFTV